MCNNHIFKQIFFSFLLLIVGHFSVLASTQNSPKIKIGLFNLLKPQQIEVKILGNESVALKTNLESNSKTNNFSPQALSPREILLLKVSSRGISCYVKDSKHQIKTHWVSNKLSISGNTNLELTVANRLTRQIQSQVNFQIAKNLLQTTLLTDQEQAVKIITASELSAIENIEDLMATESFKAFSIAIRSYISHEKNNRHKKDGYDLCDNTHCLLYLGEEALTRSKQQDIIEKAVRETCKMNISFHNQIVPGYFTACCGGLTALPNEVWTGKHHNSYNFQSVKCDYCSKNRFYKWERTIKTKELWKALESILTFQPNETTQIIAKHNSKGIVTEILVKDQHLQIKVPISKFRHLVGQELGWNLVLSNFFQIMPQRKQLIFQGKGFGHNLGLCMAGAIEQSRQGHSFSEILGFYFPNTTLSQFD